MAKYFEIFTDHNFFKVLRYKKFSDEMLQYDTEIEPSKSTDPVSKGNVILDNMTKKTGRKKSKSKFVLALLTSSSIQTQPNQASKNDVKLDESFKNMIKKSTKILDEKKKHYPKNNLKKLL